MIGDNVRKELHRHVAGWTLDELLDVDRAKLETNIGDVFAKRLPDGDGALLHASETVMASLPSVDPVGQSMSAFQEVSSSQYDRDSTLVNAQRLTESLVSRTPGNATYEIGRARGEAERKTAAAGAESKAIRVDVGVARQALDVLHYILWREKLEMSFAARHHPTPNPPPRKQPPRQQRACNRSPWNRTGIVRYRRASNGQYIRETTSAQLPTRCLAIHWTTARKRIL